MQLIITSKCRNMKFLTIWYTQIPPQTLNDEPISRLQSSRDIKLKESCSNICYASAGLQEIWDVQSNRTWESVMPNAAKLTSVLNCKNFTKHCTFLKKHWTLKTAHWPWVWLRLRQSDLICRIYHVTDSPPTSFTTSSQKKENKKEVFWRYSQKGSLTYLISE